MLARCSIPRLAATLTAAPLSPAAVDRTLSRLPSDALALTFFLWCARQPHYFHPPSSYDLVLPAARRLTDRLGSVAALSNHLHSLGCPSQQPHTLLTLLRIYSRGGMHAPALEVFDEMSARGLTPNTLARNLVLDVLFKVRRHNEAMRFFRQTPSPNFITFNILLRNLGELGDCAGVRDVLKEMVQRRFKLNEGTFVVAFDCFRKAGRVTEVVQLLGFMVVSGERLSVSIWTMLIDCFCRIGKVDVATSLLGKMVDSGCSPNVVTCTAVIKGLSEAGMHDEVLEVFHTMLSKGCTPDLVMYNVLIDAMTKARRFRDGLAVFLDLRMRKIEPDSYTLSSLMSLLRLSGKTSLLTRLVAGVDVSVDLVTCNSLMIFLCKAGFPSQAVEFYRDIIDMGYTPDSYSFVGLLSGLCKLGMVDYAVNVYHAIVKDSPDIDAYVHTAILDGLVKRGKYHRAFRLFREAVDGNHRLDVVSYTTVIHGLFQAGCYDNARNLFDQMKQSGVVPNTCTYNVMLHGLCRDKDITAVKQLLEDMRSAGVELDCISLNTITCLLFKTRRVRPGVFLLMKMCDMGMKPSRATYLQLLHVLDHACDGEATDLFPEFRYNLEDTTFVASDASDLKDKLPLCVGE